MTPELSVIILGVIAFLLKKLVDSSTDTSNKVAAMDEKLSSAHKRIDEQKAVIDMLRERDHKLQNEITALNLKLAGLSTQGRVNEINR